MTATTPLSRIESHTLLAIRQALSLCQRHQHPVTVLALEVEELDALRADIGEARMETLVSLLAEHLQQFKRCEDLLISNADSHIMLVVLPATDVHGGHRLAQRLLSRFAHEDIQLDEFQVEVSLRIALHGCDAVASPDPQPLIEATLALLDESDTPETQLVLSAAARQALDLPRPSASDDLSASLLARAGRKGDRDLLDTLKPALSRLPESERMKLVDHLLDLSTRLDSGLSRH